jgi:hypothetical protein
MHQTRPNTSGFSHRAEAVYCSASEGNNILICRERSSVSRLACVAFAHGYRQRQREIVGADR